MKKRNLAAVLAAALLLAGCASVPIERIESDIARIERGVALASSLAEAAAAAGALDARGLARIRSAVDAARTALALARDAAAAGHKVRAEALAREAEARLGGAAAELHPAGPGVGT
jgi:hypothetical protein